MARTTQTRDPRTAVEREAVAKVVATFARPDQRTIPGLTLVACAIAGEADETCLAGSVDGVRWL